MDSSQGTFPPAPGERFAGRYELRSVIRGSGSARTYEARDLQTARDVTLDVYDPSHATPEAWSRFVAAVRAAERADIAGLRLTRGLPDPPPPLLVHVGERLGGVGIDRMCKLAGKLPWQRALSLGEQIAGVLQEVHAALGVGHRALTPDRCVVIGEQVVVLDHGVAELEPASGRADDGGYLAPEQETERGDARSDIYSLAAIVFESISGKRHPRKSRACLRALVPGVPQALEDLLAKALARDPKQRHADVVGLRTCMRELLGLPAEVKPLTPAIAVVTKPELALASMDNNTGVAPLNVVEAPLAAYPIASPMPEARVMDGLLRPLPALEVEAQARRTAVPLVTPALTLTQCASDALIFEREERQVTERALIRTRSPVQALTPREPTMQLPGSDAADAYRPLRRSKKAKSPDHIDDQADAPTAVWPRMKLVVSSPTQRLPLPDLITERTEPALLGEKIPRARMAATERLPLPLVTHEPPASGGVAPLRRHAIDTSPPRDAHAEQTRDLTIEAPASSAWGELLPPTRLLIAVNVVLLGVVIVWLVSLSLR